MLYSSSLPLKLGSRLAICLGEEWGWPSCLRNGQHSDFQVPKSKQSLKLVQSHFTV